VGLVRKGEGLLVTDFSEGFWVVNCDLDTHFTSKLIKIKINTSNLSILNPSRHLLRRPSLSQHIPINQLTLKRTLPMSLNNINSPNRIHILLLPVPTLILYFIHSIDHQLSEEITLRTNQLRRHRCLAAVDQRIFSQLIDFDAHIILRKNN